MKRLLTLLLSGIILIGVLSGCSGGEKEEQKETETGQTQVVEEPETITVTDGLGREIMVDGPVESVVSGLNIVTELLTVLDMQDLVIGIDLSTSVSSLFPNLSHLPVVQTSEDSHYDIDVEAVIALEPDVFLTGVLPSDGFDEIVAALEPEIPVIALSYDTTEDIVTSMKLLGEIFDCQDAADEYIEFYRGTVDMIAGRVAGIPEDEKPVVYFEWMPYYTFNKDVYIYNNQIVIPGGINAAADMPTPYGTIDPEWVIDQNPDVIIAMAMPYSYMGLDPVECGYEVRDDSSIKVFHESVFNRSEFSDVNAVKNGRVYIVHCELPTTSCIGFAYMAKWLHPDLFSDLDPRALYQEWLTRFIRIDYDLSEQGVFVYPEPVN